MKKKLFALLLSVLCIGALVGCGSKSDSDYDYITSNGKMIIGITEYEPMNYYDEDGNLTGFDTEFAEMVCEKLGVTPEFQIIDWEMKETVLKAQNIDCIWNGLTVTEERRENMDFSDTYLANRQCIVINAEDAATYTDTAGLAGALLTAEAGSAGETAIQADENLSQASYTASTSQADALLGLKAGNYDAIVIDYTLANASVGTGDYADMVILEDVRLADELYAIGFRVGSDMTDKVNAIIAEMKADGSLAALAEKYELTELYESVE
ncbi:MAG: transporter substrate-binding domain-containing protein [Lachnospiraceae bacterium]